MKKIYKILIIIILFLIISFNTFLKDSFNVLMEKILIREEKELIIKDDMINTYINGLEKEINNFNKISSINNCIDARVIYRTPTYWYDTFIINKGAVDGVNKKDIVINDKGLVGTVINIYKNSSLVSLITNVDNKKTITVGITNKNDTIYGTIKEYNKIKRELIINNLTSNIEGELEVVTTNFTEIFKENILIAKVKELKDENNGLSKYAVATPIVDYNDIKYVCVINDTI